MPYKYEVYNVQDQARKDASMKAIHALEADGWQVHTVGTNFAELCIFWVKFPEDAPAADDSPSPTVLPANPPKGTGKHSSGSDGYAAS